jgi:desumoylating isopeptidase 1
MNVQLYVYDLSGGLARSMSAAFLGVQIDAIYHTSIVVGGLEYVYDGGIKTVHPGSTHLGQPMEIVELGTTGLPLDVIMEYLDSMKEIFTPEVRFQIWHCGCHFIGTSTADG